MYLIPRTSPSHWYDREGNPVHTFTDRNGVTRSTTVREARRFGLLPSVTNILSVIAKPQLTAWLQEQAIYAALTVPRRDGESLDDFARRVAKDASTVSKKAAEFGSHIHREVEKFLKTSRFEHDSEVKPFLDYFALWAETNIASVIHVELPCVNKKHAYAGTIDILFTDTQGRTVLADIKTQRYDKKPKLYKTWLYQLAAYKEILHDLNPGNPLRCVNIVINSTTPMKPEVHEWSAQDLATAFNVFLSTYELWKFENDYNPTYCVRHLC